MFQAAGGDDHRGNVAGFRIQILFRQELLDGINGHGLINGAPGAGLLAALVADPAADRREGVVLFDQGQSLLILALGRQLQVALDCHMGRTGGFTGGGALVVAVLPVVVPVVRVPMLRAPGNGVGQLVLGVLHGVPLLVAELLAQLHGTGGAILHALAAGHALAALYLRGIGGPGQVGGVEQLRGSQGVADLHIAVADAENLIFAINIGDLVDKSVFLGFPQDLHGLFISNVVALAGFPAVVGKVAHTDAPGGGVIGTTFSHNAPAGPAGALGNADVALVLFEPVGQMLNIQALVFHGNGLLHGNDVHAHAAATGGHQVGLPRQRDIGHALKEGGQLRMVLEPLVIRDLSPLVIAGDLTAAALVNVQQLRGAGDEHGHKVPPLGLGGGAAVVVIVVAVVIFQKAQEGQFIQNFLKMLLIFLLNLAHFPQLRDGVGLADLHGQHDVAHFVGEDGLQTPVFRVIGADASQLVGHHVGDHFADLQDLFPGSGVTLGLGLKGPAFQFLIDHKFLPFNPFLLSYFCFQSSMRCRSHWARASTPSPVLALMGKI